MPYRSKYEKNYETVRPTCYFDLKQIDYFMPTKKHTVERYDIEKKFIKISGGTVKVLGKHQAEIRLHREVKAQLEFEVTKAEDKE